MEFARDFGSFSSSIFLYLASVLPSQHAEFVKRRAVLRGLVFGTKYACQKDRLRLDFEKFLVERASCPSPLATAPSLLDASPSDVVRFLHARDTGGRTQVHCFKCEHFGASGIFTCGCPRHLAAGTVDSYVGQLRAVFNALGRVGAANPCSSDEVKGWVRACALEQRRHRVPVKQAKPTFSTHLRLLVKEIMLRLATLPAGEPFLPDRFLLLRDWAFFCIQWFAGDRAGDLGRALGREVVRLGEGSLLFNHTVGKTIRSADGQLLVVPRVTDEPSLCPVEAFDRYASACLSSGIDLKQGYLFSPLNARLDRIRNAPFSSSAATKRLRSYLPDLELSAHGARAGCAITLLMLGASQEAVMDHCRWATAQVARHYAKLDRVRRLGSSAELLKSGVAASDGPSEADSAAHLYEILNNCVQTPAL